MLVKIKRLTKAKEKSIKGYYLNNLEESIDDFMERYNRFSKDNKIIKINRDHITFDLDPSTHQDILDSPDDYRVVFHYIGQHDIDEVSDETIVVQQIYKFEFRKVV